MFDHSCEYREVERAKAEIIIQNANARIVKAIKDGIMAKDDIAGYPTTLGKQDAFYQCRICKAWYIQPKA